MAIEGNVQRLDGLSAAVDELSASSSPALPSMTSTLPLPFRPPSLFLPQISLSTIAPSPPWNHSTNFRSIPNFSTFSASDPTPLQLSLVQFRIAPQTPTTSRPHTFYHHTHTPKPPFHQRIFSPWEHACHQNRIHPKLDGIER